MKFSGICLITEDVSHLIAFYAHFGLETQMETL